jgi:hypothetical protein
MKLAVTLAWFHSWRAVTLMSLVTAVTLMTPVSENHGDQCFVKNQTISTQIHLNYVG